MEVPLRGSWAYDTAPTRTYVDEGGYARAERDYAERRLGSYYSVYIPRKEEASGIITRDEYYCYNPREPIKSAEWLTYRSLLEDGGPAGECDYPWEDSPATKMLRLNEEDDIPRELARDNRTGVVDDMLAASLEWEADTSQFWPRPPAGFWDSEILQLLKAPERVAEELPLLVGTWVFPQCPSPEMICMYRKAKDRRGHFQDEKIAAEARIEPSRRRSLDPSLEDWTVPHVYSVLQAFHEHSIHRGEFWTARLHDPLRQPYWLIHDYTCEDSWGPGPLPYGLYRCNAWEGKQVLARRYWLGETLLRVLLEGWTGPLAAVWLPERCVTQYAGKMYAEYLLREEDEEWDDVPSCRHFGDDLPLTFERLSILRGITIWPPGTGRVLKERLEERMEKQTQQLRVYPVLQGRLLPFYQEEGEPTPFLVARATPK